AAGYHTDQNYPVTGRIVGDSLVFRAPAQAFGLSEGEEVFSASAFAMAGPSEEEETLVFNVMRTVDATPPFDAVLQEPRVASSVQLAPREATRQPGSVQTVTASVFDSTGQPLSGALVDWRSVGVGEVLGGDVITDHAGRARAVVRSDEPGNQEMTVRAEDCAPAGDCVASAIVHWGPDYCDIFGTVADNQLDGSDRGEVICGFGGNDLIFGRAGHDVLLGGEGDDALHGGPGGDILKGGAGSDTLTGGRGADPCAGGAGRDRARSCD
ncbi:MAG TPA: Ig-like domain-containing protein, partial [Dehalococcoidia bacterium]|nr:Ig-like domain-containing protein [Dehalococcoidia bacterium]